MASRRQSTAIFAFAAAGFPRSAARIVTSPAILLDGQRFSRYRCLDKRWFQLLLQGGRFPFCVDTMNSKSIRRLLCLIFGSVFVYAGLLKASDPMTFLDDIRSFQLLPDPFAAWLALGLPWLEIFAGLAVITGVLRAGGLLTLNLLLLIFLAAILISWTRGLDLSCGCFGGDTAASDYPTLIIRDLALLALGFACARIQEQRLLPLPQP
jgi:uncharacterized membrane protein YphA (DoxX/SURF4 family)